METRWKLSFSSVSGAKLNNYFSNHHQIWYTTYPYHGGVPFGCYNILQILILSVSMETRWKLLFSSVSGA